MPHSTLACVSCLTMRASIANFLPCFMTSINRWAFSPTLPYHTQRLTLYASIATLLPCFIISINRWMFCPTPPCHTYRVLLCVCPTCCPFSWPQSTGGCFAHSTMSYLSCVALFYDLSQHVDVLPTLPCHTYRVFFLHFFYFVCVHSQHVALSHDITQQVDISGCGQRSCVCWFLLRSQVGLYTCTSPLSPTNKWTLIHWRVYLTHPYVIDRYIDWHRDTYIGT